MCVCVCVCVCVRGVLWCEYVCVSVCAFQVILRLHVLKTSKQIQGEFPHASGARVTSLQRLLEENVLEELRL